MLRKICGLLLCLCLCLPMGGVVTAQAADTPSAETVQAIADILSGQPGTVITEGDTRLPYRFDNSGFAIREANDPAYIIRFCPDISQTGRIEQGFVCLPDGKFFDPLWDSIYFIPGDKLFVANYEWLSCPPETEGVIFRTYEDDGTEAPYTPFYEIDYQGNLTPVYIDGRHTRVDEEGYITLHQYAVVDLGTVHSDYDGAPSRWTLGWNALLDNNYHLVMDYIAEDDDTWVNPEDPYIFHDDLAIVQIGSTEWTWRPNNQPRLLGNGKFGIINRRGEFIIPAVYEQLMYIGEHTYQVYRGGVAAETFVAKDIAATAPSEWLQDIVDKAIAQGIVPARLQNHYQQPITRAEFCALAVALFEKTTGKPIMVRGTFADTTDVCVQKLRGLGVLSGTGADEFLPDAPVTREQAAVILVNLAQALKRPLPLAEADFSDCAAIAPWAKDQVGQAQAAGILRNVGDGRFAPKDVCTREQSILAMLNLWTVLEK